MSTKKRKPSVATQLKNLQAEHAAAQQQIAKLQKDLDSTKNTLTYTQNAKAAAEAELTAMHSLLDALPNPIPRKSESSEAVPYPQPHPASTRLAAWLAVRSTL